MSDAANLSLSFVAIPSMPFLMGTPEAELSELARLFGGTRESYREEAPQIELTLPRFDIARAPVTNALYACFVAATGAQPPIIWRGTQPPDTLLHHPVVDVSWQQAQDFCAWLSAASAQEDWLPQDCHYKRFRLPTQEEWEHAARGTDGRRFPWGNESDPKRANVRERGLQTTTAVAAFAESASPYGVLQMAGNIWEWTASPDCADPDAERYILRGGCYANPIGFARCACRFRLAPHVRNVFTGLRLVCEEL